MTTLSRAALAAAAFGSICLSSAVSSAHVDLQSPIPRLGGRAADPQLKRGPCGQNADSRTANVNVFTPGQTITVRWTEYVDHPAYYRIAFDPDGDNFPMRTGVPNAAQPEAANVVDAAEKALFNGSDSLLLATVPEVNGTASSATVTLPNIECENCTLQLIQFMYNNTAQGYYQCADIALRRAATVDPGGGDNSGGETADAGTGAEPGSEDGGSATVPVTSGNSSSGVGATSTPRPVSGGEAPGGTSTGSVPATTANPLQPAPSGSAAPSAPAPVAAQADGDDDGGCSFGPGSGSRKAGFGALVVMGLGLTGAMRRRKQAR